MQPTNYVKAVAALVLVALVAVGWQTRATWKGWLIQGADATDEGKKKPAAEKPQSVKLSPQA